MAGSVQKIVDILQNHPEPLALSAIKAALPEVVPERTLQRWLQQAVESGRVIASGSKRGRVYRKADGQEVIDPAGHFRFSPESQQAIERIRQPLVTRPLRTYAPEWLEDYRPNQTFYLPASLRQRLLQEGRHSSVELPAGTYAHQIFQRLLIDLSYNSSRLEGNTYSLSDTEQLLLGGVAAEGKRDEEKVMLLNHKEAIRLLVDGINRMEISVDNIRSLHYLLADGLVGQGAAGTIRADMVRVSSSAYLPMTGQTRLTQQLERVTAIARLIDDPFEQSIFLLVHVSYLQAFIDVNKRTARLACNIPLVRSNLVPLSFNDLSKDDYASAMLVVYEENSVEPLVELYGWSYLRSCQVTVQPPPTHGADPLGCNRAAARHPKKI